MITIHNFQNGARGVRIAWLCEEMGLPYQPVVHAFPTSAEYRAKYPLGSVPFIEDPDHGVGMGESVAILLHLAMTYGPTSLAPQEPVARSRMLEIAVMSEAGLGGWLNMLLTDRYAAPPEQKGGWLTGMGQTQVRRMLDHLAARKGDLPYLSGREFTLADNVARHVGACTVGGRSRVSCSVAQHSSQPARLRKGSPGICVKRQGKPPRSFQ